MSSSRCKLALSRPTVPFGWSEIVPTSLLGSDSTTQPAERWGRLPIALGRGSSWAGSAGTWSSPARAAPRRSTLIGTKQSSIGAQELLGLLVLAAPQRRRPGADAPLSGGIVAMSVRNRLIAGHLELLRDSNPDPRLKRFGQAETVARCKFTPSVPWNPCATLLLAARLSK